MVRTFEEDTGLPLNLENFLLEYNILYQQFTYPEYGAGSLFRLKKWANIIEEDDRDVDDKLQYDDRIFRTEYWSFWIIGSRYIDGNKVANEEERIMRNMLYYTFYKKHPAKCGFQSIDEEVEIRSKGNFCKR